MRESDVAGKTFYDVEVRFSVRVTEEQARNLDPRDLENGANWYALDLIAADLDNVTHECIAQRVEYLDQASAPGDLP